MLRFRTAYPHPANPAHAVPFPSEAENAQVLVHRAYRFRRSLVIHRSPLPPPARPRKEASPSLVSESRFRSAVK